MTSENFTKTIQERFDKCFKTLCQKSEEYANDEDRLRAFKAAAAIEKTTPEVALSGMLAKHLVSIYDMLPGLEQYSKEKWDEKIGDAINYLFLLDALLEERNTGKSFKNSENSTIQIL